MNRKIFRSLLIAAACTAFVMAQTVTPTLAKAKLRPPATPTGGVPPAIVSIAAQSGAPGTRTTPIAAADPIIVTFSNPVSLVSFDLVSNFLVRNLAGVQVPGFIAPLTPGATDDSVYVFTPIAPYGPGVSPTQGFDIEVRVGSFGLPPAASPPILGTSFQLPLSNSLSRVFRTTPCAGCLTPAAIAESFDTTAQQDASFFPVFGPTRWNAASAPSQFAGRAISGSPTGMGPAGLGTRVQVVVDPQPPSTVPAGLFAPFDASAAWSGGQCGAGGCNIGINQQGGSHIMHLYESADLQNIKDSLEQIEWSPVGGVTAASTYPAYQLWCGVTNKGASGTPPPPPFPFGLDAMMERNYSIHYPYQSGELINPACANPSTMNPRKVLCNGPMPYAVTARTTQWYPFPVMAPCFDYATSTGAGGSPGVNLLLEQNIEPGNQVPNLNRYRSTANTAVRRLIDGPLSQLSPGTCPSNQGGASDIYRMRFTFVGLVAQERSLWYDTGTADPNYLAFLTSPPIGAQPPGTQSTWILEGTDALNPIPGTTGTQGTYISAAGTVNPNVLTSPTAGIGQKRYFRFRVEFRGNNLTNMAPSYGSVLMGYTF